MSRPNPTTRRSTRAEYIETDSGNKISRRAHIEGKAHIRIVGKSVVMADTHLRGDLHRLPPPEDNSDKAKDKDSSGAASQPAYAILVGKYSVISTGSVLSPPCRLARGVMTYYPIKIGDDVFVGPGCYVSSASIAGHCWIGEGCVLGAFSMVKEGCRILPGTVLAPYSVVGPGVVVGGRPGRVVGEVGEGWGVAVGEEVVEGGDLRELVRGIKG